MYFFQVNNLKTKKSLFYDKYNNLISEIPEHIKKIPLGFPKGILYDPPRKNVYAIAVDSKNRRQYFYVPKYKEKKRLDKFSNNETVIYDSVKVLNSALKKIRYQKNKDIDYLIAFVIMIMANCNFRVGNEKYEKLYNTYGAINFKIDSVKYKNKEFVIKFIGKKGEENKCFINQKNNLYKTMKENYLCKKKDKSFFDKPFISYKDENTGEIITLKYNDVYSYFKKNNIRPKDIRMIQANIIFLSILKENQETIPEKEGEYKRWLKGLYEITADKMNNTPTVCKKEYVHPKFNKKNIRSMKLLLSQLNKSDDLYNFLEYHIKHG